MSSTLAASSGRSEKTPLLDPMSEAVESWLEKGLRRR